MREFGADGGAAFGAGPGAEAAAEGGDTTWEPIVRGAWRNGTGRHGTEQR